MFVKKKKIPPCLSLLPFLCPPPPPTRLPRDGEGVGGLQGQAPPRPRAGGGAVLARVDLPRPAAAVAGQGGGGQEPPHARLPGLPALGHARHAQPRPRPRPPAGALLRAAVSPPRPKGVAGSIRRHDDLRVATAHLLGVSPEEASAGLGRFLTPLLKRVGKKSRKSWTPLVRFWRRRSRADGVKGPTFSRM